MMKKIIILPILLILITLYFFIINRYDSYVMLPISTSVLIILFFYDFVLVRVNLKNGKALRLGKDSNAKWGMIMGVVGGLVFFAIGFRVHSNGVEYWGISSTSYLGIFFIAMGLLTYENFFMLVSDKYLKYKDFLVNPELRYKKIKQIQIDKNKMFITAKRDSVDYDISDENERAKLINFLKPRLGDKLIVNE